MKLSLFNYNLPKSRIAQKPASPRDHSRLLIFDQKTKKVNHDIFYNLDKYLTDNDVLVFNNTKVMPARIVGNKETGGRAEALLLEQESDGKWIAMIGTKRPKIGSKLRFKQELEVTLVKPHLGKTWLVEFNKKGEEFYATLDKIGQMPLPPYIKSTETQSKLKKQYQTIFAKNTGSAAAPTASLHFTQRLMKKIQKKGAKLEYVTLHVGLGTFEPVDTEDIRDFQIHKEWISIDKQTMANLIEAKKQGKRIIAVGTTALRVLESAFQKEHKKAKDFSQKTGIFIYPGYEFKFIDSLITNFHLPKSSLLMLVSALIGRKKTIEIYEKAIRAKYRFFSFGDGMFIK